MEDPAEDAPQTNGLTNTQTADDAGTISLYGGSAMALAETDYSQTEADLEPTDDSVVSVTVGEETHYYTSLSEAFEAASSVDGAAEVKLLKDIGPTMNDSGNFEVSGGTITFDLNGCTWTEGTMNFQLLLKNCEMTLRDSSADGTGKIKNTGSSPDGGNAIRVDSGASLLVESGSVESAGNSGYGINVNNGKLTVQGGTFTGGISGIFLYSGNLNIEAGTLSGQNGLFIGYNASKDATVLSGGTYVGGIRISSGPANITVADLLGSGFGYYDEAEKTWVKDTAVMELTDTITVAEAPIQSVGISPDTTTITYGDTAPTLTAEVKQPEGSTNGVTYRWYLNGTEITGATSAAYTPDKLSVGDYAYTCTATADGYSLTSADATVKVEQKEVVLTFTGDTTKTYDETTDGPNGLSIEIENAVSGDDVIATAASYTYNSPDVKDAKTITANNVALSGTDAGNYKLPEGSITTSGTITKSTPVITFKDSSITITYSGKELSYPFRDYMIVDGASIEDIVFSWTDSANNLLDSAPVNAGTYTITATIAETGNTNKATNSIKVHILTRTVSDLTITLEKDSYEYDGTAKEPTVKVFDGKTELDPKEYTVTYSNNVEVGTDATVTITNNEGGNYEINKSTVSFQITKPSLENATVTLALPDEGYTYDGQPKEPEVTVLKNGVTLKKDTDYTVTYTGNVNAGTATVTVTAVEGGNYSGSQSVTFKIAQASLADAVVTPAEALVYSGEPQTQTVIVTLGDQTLKAGKDYTVSGNTGTDAGSGYTLTVSGTGNYTGEVTYKWSIAPAPVTVDPVTATPRSYKPNDTEVDVQVTLSGAVNNETIGYTATGAMTTPDAGTGKAVNVTIQLTGNNYVFANGSKETTTTATVDIAKAEQAALSITGLPEGDIRYGDTFTLSTTGGSGTGDVTWAVTSGEQYAQIDPATGKVEITGVGEVKVAATKSGDTNYEAADATVTFTTKAQAQAALTITGLPDAETLVYGRETFPLSTAGGSGTGAVTWAVTSGEQYAQIDPATGKVEITGAGKVTVTATKAADGNYDEATAEITFTIGKAPASDAPDYELPSGLTATYGEALSDVELPEHWSWMDGTELVGDTGDREHLARFTPKDTTNYEIAENISLTVRVQRAAGPAAPTVAVRYAPGADGETFVCTVEATLSALPGAALEYRMDDGDWQTSPVFEGIAPESEHTFVARAAVTANYEAGQEGEYSQTFARLEREADDVPPLAVSVSGESASRTVTIEPVEGAEYSFDGGLTWSADNTLTGIDSTKTVTVAVGIRYAETVTLLASEANTREVSTIKEAHAAPETMELDFTIAPDGTYYSASLPAVDGLLYSADGVNYEAPAEGADAVTLYEDCEPGKKYTAYIKYAETDEFAESAPTRVTGTAPAWSVEDPIEQEDVDELSIILRLNPDELTEVPAGLQAQYDTPEQLESELISRVTTQLLPSSGAGAPDASDAPSLAGTAVYDVTLEFSLDDGKTWIEATESNFPEDGLRVALECPAVDGDPADYQFAVVHIFTVDMNDHKAGDVETPVVTYNAEQNTLTFTVHGLSPVAVGWTLRDQPAQPEQSGSSGSDGDVEALIGAAVVIGGGAAWLAYQYRADLPIWKLAGVVTLAAADSTAAGAPVADASVTLYQDGEAVKTLTTDESGLFTARVPKGTYEAVVTWERDGVAYTARREVVAESVLDDGAVQQIVLQAAERSAAPQA